MATQDQQNNNSLPTFRQSLQSNLSQQTFKIRGMKTDLSESSFENEYAFENMNMRINIVDSDNTLLNLTNERGTLQKTSVVGIPIGVKKYDVNKILLVTTVPNGGSNKDKFWNVTCSGDTLSVTMFRDSSNNNVQSDFGFDVTHPLEIEHYKDGNRDFFYIADGINNLKAFWVEGPYIYSSNNRLEYNSYISGEEKLYVKYTESRLSNFYAGAIVYCYCYITKQGHKTNIIDFTDVIYIENSDCVGGLEPNKKSNIYFKIGGFNMSSEFDKVEIYSLFRSSLDGEITCRKVGTTKINEIGFFEDERVVYPSNPSDHYKEGRYPNSFEIQDLNQGEIVSYQELLQRFNSLLIPSTITIKTNSIFLGNITTNNYSSLKNYLINNTLNGLSIYGTASENLFLNKNKYFAGIQLQDKYGNWSPVIYAGPIKYGQKVKLNSDLISLLKELGYVAVRGMNLYSKQIRNSVCHGFMLPTFSFDNGKYGIDYYSQYRIGCSNKDLYYDEFNTLESSICDIYSPDVEFNENFNISKCFLMYKEIEIPDYSEYVKINITLSSNTGTLYNSNNSTESEYIGKAEYDAKHKNFIWYDAITKFQEALQLQFSGIEDKTLYGDEAENIKSLVPLYYINQIGIHDKPVRYKIYIWQPSGSLNDSNGYTSILNTKKISYVNKCNLYSFISNKSNTDWTQTSSELSIFDGTTNVLPINDKIYGGIINFKYYNKTWSFQHRDNLNGDNIYVDDNQYIYKNYVLSYMENYSYVGQPIEVGFFNNLSNSFLTTVDYTIWDKICNDNNIKDPTGWNKNNPIFFVWGGAHGTSMVREKYFNINAEKWLSYFHRENQNGSPVPVLISCNHNRNGVINIAYKTTKHLVTNSDIYTNGTNHVYETLLYFNDDYSLTNKDIENGQWIKSSINYKLANSDIEINFHIDDVYKFDYYNCLKTEAYSPYDTNQIFHLFQLKGVYSYINPKCNYSKYQQYSVASNIRDATDLSSSIMNKLNLVYNQKNNFFIFSGITSDTVTDDTLENTILYSDTKVANEKEDAFVNLPITNFYAIDSNINKINKLIVYNDKLLCFSDDAIVQILYNENVVINTDSVQSLGLASSDKVTGSQLITNTYGCLNKWSIGISNNVLYFNDDLNSKIFAYDGQFHCLNEEFGIQTLNNKLFKNVVWNPNDFGNTKLNIDRYTADIHYTGDDIDIAFNENIGNFTSLYSYEALPYISTIGQHTIGFQNKSGNTYLHFLREGNYNQFFDIYTPFYTTVIINNNSLVTKMLSNVEFSSEAYSLNNGSLLPQHNYTFSHVEFYNDYQRNKVKIDYKLYGQSLLKRKFRIWRINRFRNYTRMHNRNYDMISNPWTYLKLLVEGNALESNRKLTLHWINVNYR